MATLNSVQLAKICNACVGELSGSDRPLKSQLYPVIQAVETAWGDFRPTLAAAMTAAEVGGRTFTGADQKAIGREWMRLKFGLGG